MQDQDHHRYYEEALRQHGSSARGVGWKNEEAQANRFGALSRIIDQRSEFSINDLGCGNAAFYSFLSQNGWTNFEYTGYDVLPSMIELAQAELKGKPCAEVKMIQAADEMQPADYTVASGIFNLKHAADNDTWLKYILSTIAAMNSWSRKGFSFNMLTSYSDADKMREELFYGDPCFFFDHCKRLYSRNVALLHDYHEYDFTILVRK